MSANIRKYGKHCLPPVITAVLLCIILFIKGIFPFGSETIDYYDMAQQISAFYYHTYDMLHGTKAFFYDWYTGLGVNMAMSTSGCSNLSLFNLFFLFVKRDYLLNSLSIFLLIKMMCMSSTMYFYLHKTRRISFAYETLLSVGYAFCGFVLLLYMTNQWMDIAIFFPLIVYFTEKLLKEGRTVGYIVTLAIIMINSYYITFMILIYIIVMTGLKLLCDRVVEGKRSIAAANHRYFLVRLLTSTLLAIGISCFILVPQMVQTLGSARFGYAKEDGGLFSWYYGIISQVQGAYTTRYFALYGLSFAAVIVAYGLIRVKLKKNERFMIIGSIILIVSELFFESVNLMWHYGSYIQYPIRNGFMINFTVAASAAYILEKMAENAVENATESSVEAKMDAKRTFPLVQVISTVIMAVISVIILVFGIKAYAAHPGLSVRSVFHIVVIVMTSCFVLYLLIFILFSRRLRMPVCLLPFVACEFIFYGFLMFGKPTFVTGYSEEPEEEGEYIRICNQVRDAFNIEEDTLKRIKNPDESMNSNYGLCLRRASLSNWTHLISPDLLDGVGKWGCTIQFTRLLDAGGTVFTDALLGVKNTISLIPQDPVLYEAVDSAEIEIDHRTGEKAEYTYYNNRYTLPWCVKVKGGSQINMDGADMVSLHNDVYAAITGDETPIAEWVYGEDYRNKELVQPFLEQIGLSAYGYDDEETEDEADSETTPDDEKIITGVVNDTISVSGNKLLYFVANSLDEEFYDYEISVNGKIIPIPSIKEKDNTKYPAHFNNNAVYLGNFCDEDVDLSLNIDFCRKYNNYDFNICEIDFDMFKKLCDEYANMEPVITAGDSSLVIKTYAYESQTLILPVAYDDGFTVTVNGNEVNTERYAGMFTAIPLLDGENEVIMTFFPSGMKAGIIITIISLLIFVISTFTKIRKKYVPSEGEINADMQFSGICLLGYYVILLFMYIVPIVYGVIARIIGVFVK